MTFSCIVSVIRRVIGRNSDCFHILTFLLRVTQLDFRNDISLVKIKMVKWKSPNESFGVLISHRVWQTSAHLLTALLFEPYIITHASCVQSRGISNLVCHWMSISCVFSSALCIQRKDTSVKNTRGCAETSYQTIVDRQCWLLMIMTPQFSSCGWSVQMHVEIRRSYLIQSYKILKGKYCVNE